MQEEKSKNNLVLLVTKDPLAKLVREQPAYNKTKYQG
jgi:hypothetical protein